MARNIRAICLPISLERSAPKSTSRTSTPITRKRWCGRCAGSNSGPEAASLHGILERLGQFEGLIQNQHYLPYAEFRLLPYFKRARKHPQEWSPEGTASTREAGAEAGPKPAAPAPEPTAIKAKDRAAETARKWLAARLADGEWHDSASIIGPAFQQAGLTKPTLYRARKELGVVTAEAHGFGSLRLAAAQGGGKPMTAGAFRLFAEALLHAGYSPLPIVPGRKKPALREWPNFCAAVPASRAIKAGCKGITAFYRRAACAAWRLAFDPADDEPVEKLRRRLLLAAKVNNAADTQRFVCRIEDVELPGGTSTSRVVFLPAAGPMRGAPRRLRKKQSMNAPATAGISIPARYRAAASLGVQPEPVDGSQRKSWRLTDDAP